MRTPQDRQEPKGDPPVTAPLNELASALPRTEEALVTRNLKYSYEGRWGMVDTPTTRDAKSIASEVFEYFPFIRPQASYEILSHALDNVANYSREGNQALGTLRVFALAGEVVFQVENESKTEISKKLLEKPITTADGQMHLPEKDRHPTESGGGNGLNLMTKWLPHIYRSDVVDTDKTGTLRWFQSPSENDDKVRVTFELRVPIPTEQEQAKLISIQEEQQKLERHLAAAEVVLETWAQAESGSMDPDSLESEIQTCTRALEGIIKAKQRGESTGMKEHTIFKALKQLGHLAASAAPTLRSAMLVADTAHTSQAVLLDVEQDPEKTVEFFTDELPRFIDTLGEAKKKDVRPLVVIANYAKERGNIAASLQDGLLSAFDMRLAREGIAPALAALPLTPPNRTKIGALLKSSLSPTDGDKDTTKRAATILLGQANLNSFELNLLIEGLMGEAAYHIANGLKGIQLGQDQIEFAKNQLEQALESDEKVSLHYLNTAIHQCEGDNSTLFAPVKRMLFDERYQYEASQLLEYMNLTTDQVTNLIVDTEQALRVAISAKRDNGETEKLYYPLQFLASQGDQATSIRETLVDALIAGVDEHQVSQILKSIGLTESQVDQIQTEIERRQSAQEGSTYSLEQVG